MEIETALITVERVVKLLARLNPSDRVEKVRIEQAVQALKTIAFFPSGVLAALEQIENGKKLAEEEASELSEMFQEPSPDVKQMVGMSQPISLHEWVSVSISVIKWRWTRSAIKNWTFADQSPISFKTTYLLAGKRTRRLRRVT